MIVEIFTLVVEFAVPSAEVELADAKGVESALADAAVVQLSWPDALLG